MSFWGLFGAQSPLASTVQRGLSTVSAAPSAGALQRGLSSAVGMARSAAGNVGTAMAGAMHPERLDIRPLEQAALQPAVGFDPIMPASQMQDPMRSPQQNPFQRFQGWLGEADAHGATGADRLNMMAGALRDADPGNHGAYAQAQQAALLGREQRRDEADREAMAAAYAASVDQQGRMDPSAYRRTLVGRGLPPSLEDSERLRAMERPSWQIVQTPQGLVRVDEDGRVEPVDDRRMPPETTQAPGRAQSDVTNRFGWAPWPRR